MSGTLFLAAIAPFVAFFAKDASELLGAVAAGWLVVGRAVLTRYEDANKVKAVSMQELYDTRLFHLGWNTSLCGPKPSEVDIAADARKKSKKQRRYLGWYDIDLSKTSWPGDVLLCQRQSSAWSRRDHSAYAAFLVVVSVFWFAVGVSFALVNDLELGQYLVRLFLPCSPAFLDAVELAGEHRKSASQREALELEIENQWEEYCRDAATLTRDTCRENQDASYLARRSNPRVPNLFYLFHRSTTAAATRDGTTPLLAAKNGK